MNRVLGIIRQGRVTSFVGVIAISVVIWYVGPIIGFGTNRPFEPQINRFIAIGAIVAIWLLFTLWKAYKAKKKNKEMLDKLSDDSNSGLSHDEQSTQDEVEHLDKRLQDALQVLQETKVGSGNEKQYLYQLPWYIIIGPPGAGKTTLLANSNLHFPLSDKFGKDALRGVGGTRNCDWWFTDDAILLDTAGRYTTQDSNKAVDHASWLGFLDLLKNYRKQQPVNGVIIAVSLSDMLQQTEAERLQHAKTIRKRIEELHTQLNINFPIYIMFTKADLIAGFNEFFDNLNREDREQVWGMTFPLSDTTESSNAGFNSSVFTAEFTLLEKRVHRQLIEKLDRERSQNRRQALYAFPQQFSSLKNIINDFLDETFRASHYQKPAMLRGVYFTSATQEGSPIDRIMGSLANQFGIGRQNLSSFSSQGKSFFINKLLKNVIFSESGLAGTNLQFRKRLQWLQSAAGITAIVITLVVAMLWFNSYRNNQKIIASYQSEVEEVDFLLSKSSNQSDLMSLLPLLNKVRRLTATYSDDKQTVDLSSRWGLYQGESLGEAMDTKYIQLLRGTVQPHSKQMLESLLKKNTDNPGKLFGLLKVYLYLGGQSPEGISIPAIEADWNSNQIDDPEDSQLDGHFLALLRHSSSSTFELDSELVQQSQSKLESANLTELAYESLKNTHLHPKEADDFKIIKQDGLREINQSFVRKSNKEWSSGVPGLFTKQGFYNVFLKHYAHAAADLKKDSWVLGRAKYAIGASNSVEQQVLKSYQRDYIEYWNAFINDLAIKSLGSKKQSIAILEPLTPGGENLFLKLLEAIKKETDFSEEKNEEFLGMNLELKKILGGVDQHFGKLNEYADAGKLEKITGLLDEVYIGFNNETTFGEADNNQVKSAINKLKAESLHLPASLKNMLLELTDQAGKKVDAERLKTLIAELKSELDETVGTSCQQSIKGNYPFGKRSSPDVVILSFAEFFGPNGTMDSFSKNNLKKNTQALASPIKKLNTAFKRASNIQKSFFSQGFLNIPFSLELLRVNGPFHSIDVEIGTTKQTFSAIGDEKKYQWPALGIATDFTVADPNAIPVAGQAPLAPELSQAVHEDVSPGDSPWELFKLIDSKNEIQISGATFKVKTKISPSPFNLIRKDMRKFKCPKL